MGKEKKIWVNNLASNLKKHRKKLGMTQQLLAEKSGLSITTVAKTEGCAVDNPTLDTIEAFGMALRLSDSLDLLKN